VRLPDYITRYLDATSMAYSLEARVPFLDHEFVELTAQIPPELKMRGTEEKHILRRAMTNALPAEIVRRRKIGLRGPTAQWIRELPDFASDLLSRKTIRDKGYFNDAVVTDMLAQHRSGKMDYGGVLVGVLGVQIWDDSFRQSCLTELCL
jgi:asparagine synthase (glutamine-hydrolysing)